MTERVYPREVHEERRSAGEFEHISKILSRMLNEEPVSGGEEWPQPPYGSPIEDMFASACFKYLAHDVSVDKQVKVSTKHGFLRIDFVFSVGNRRIAVECDGKDFHEPFRDELRDAILLGEGHFETVYHFRGCDIVYYPDDCIWLMSEVDPHLFSELGHFQLDRLRRLEISESRKLTGWGQFNQEFMEGSWERFTYQIGEGNAPYHFDAFRRNIYMKSGGNPSWPHWKVLYAFAGEHSGASLDELYAERTSWGSIKKRQSMKRREDEHF